MAGRDDTVAAVDAVVIGRNEGARLVACLASLSGRVRRLVYVDSGSGDGSPGAAAGMGAEVVELDPALPFTAARARNAGLARLAGEARGGEGMAEFVQFVDGDCVVQPGWIEAALGAMRTLPGATVVCGRRRERDPGTSIWNRLCDREWDTPVGEALACGGDALMRLAPVLAAGGFRDDLIAGEEPELCQRLRRAGGRIWRIEAEMTLHDAAMTRFSQWWRRSRRAGHAFAEGAALHGAGPDRHWRRETARAVFWGLGVPVAALAAGLSVPPWGFALLLLWPAQVLRLALRWRDVPAAFFGLLGKLAEAQGVLGYWAGRLLRRRRGLIEYR